MADIVGGKIVISFDDGTTSELQLAVTTPTPDPVPVPTPLPAAPNRATVNGVAHALDGINKPRQADELILLRPPLAVSETNQWGVEATVIDGKVTALSDRQKSGATTGTPIPSGGYLLSGHGAARDWLLANAKPGATVTLETVDSPAPTPKPTPDPKPTPAAGKRVAGLYLMRGQGYSTDLPAACNQVRIAFAQGSPPRLVEWGGEGTSAMAAGLAAFRKRGGQVLISVGGAGGNVNVGDHAGFVQGIRDIEKVVALDGIDWDIEGSDLPIDDVVAVSKQLASGRESTWLTTFTPSGGPPVGRYLKAAVACHNAGLLVNYAQQLYDAPVSLPAAIAQTRLAIDAGLPQSSVLLGMMVGNDASHWTVQQCIANYRAVLATFPGLGGHFLWESKRPGTTEVVNAISAL